MTAFEKWKIQHMKDTENCQVSVAEGWRRCWKAACEHCIEVVKHAHESGPLVSSETEAGVMQGTCIVLLQRETGND